jgi:hypothetical protein
MPDLINIRVSLGTLDLPGTIDVDDLVEALEGRLRGERGEPGPKGDKGDPGGVSRDEVMKIVAELLGNGNGGGGGGNAKPHRDARWKIHAGTLQAPTGEHTPLATPNTATVDSDWSGRLVEFWGPFDGALNLAPEIEQDVSLLIEGDPSNRSITIVPPPAGRLNDLVGGQRLVLPGARQWGVRVRSNQAGTNPQVTVYAIPSPDDLFMRFVDLDGSQAPVQGALAHIGRTVNISADNATGYLLPAGAWPGSAITVRMGGVGRVMVQATAGDAIERPGLGPVIIGERYGVISLIKTDRANTWALWDRGAA